MKGLILKDLYLWKRYARIYTLYLLVFGAVGAYSGMASFFVSMTSVILLTLPLSAWNYDQYNKWDRAALAGPVSRRQLVQAKYLLTLLLMTTILVLNFLFNLVMMAFHPQLEAGELLTTTLSGVLPVGFVSFLSFPFIIRFGVEKGRMVMILSCLLVVGFLVLGFGGLSAANGGLSNIPDSTFLFWLFAVGLPLLALLAAISYFLSLRFYEAREVC